MVKPPETRPPPKSHTSRKTSKTSSCVSGKKRAPCLKAEQSGKQKKAMFHLERLRPLQAISTPKHAFTADQSFKKLQHMKLRHAHAARFGELPGRWLPCTMPSTMKTGSLAGCNNPACFVRGMKSLPPTSGKIARVSSGSDSSQELTMEGQDLRCLAATPVPIPQEATSLPQD